MSSKNLFISSRVDPSWKWCVYVITYSGDKLPPFYVGYVGLDRILNEGYHGSVCSQKYEALWKSELKENPHLFRRKILRSFKTQKEAIRFEGEFLSHFGAGTSRLFVNMSSNKPSAPREPQVPRVRVGPKHAPLKGIRSWESRARNSRLNKLSSQSTLF